MKKKQNMICNKIITLLIVLLTIFNVNAQQVEFKRTINKSFKISPETSVSISNKYGSINIVKSNNDSISFMIEIKASDKDSAKATKIFNNVDLQFDASPFNIVAKTIFIDYKGSVWTNISDFANNTIKGSFKIEINWKVAIPENIELKVDNKFGNIYTLNHNNKLTVDLSNGNFQASNLQGKSNVKVEFGNVKIANVNLGKLELSYVNGDIMMAKNLDLYSRSSTINLTEVTNLEINSRHDKLYIDSVNVFKGEAGMSLIKVNKATKNTMLNLKYGSIYFNTVNNSTSNMFVSSVSTDVYMYYDKSFSSKFESTYRKATLVFPSAFDSFTKVLVDEKLQQYKINGEIGDIKPASSEVKLNFSSGILSVGVK